tara:strand:- start:3161 stop:3397 length:237 start_codon:yes stop_codon:yes gene_type:complete
MKDERLAVLIDADNVPYANVKEMLDEIANMGIQPLNEYTQTGPSLPYRDGRVFYWKTQLPPSNNTVTLLVKTRVIVPL